MTVWSRMARGSPLLMKRCAFNFSPDLLSLLAAPATGLLFVACWLPNVPGTCLVYLRDRSAQTSLRSAILR